MRAIAPATGLLLLAACAPQDQGEARAALAPLALCGVPAATGPGRPERYRTHPPACSLPSAETIALSCAIHDTVRTDGYRPPISEWEEAPPGYEPTPLPEYRAREVSCRFSNADRSEALCELQLARSGESAAFEQVTVRLSHRFYRMDGPVSHVYGTHWGVEGECGAGPMARH